VERHSDDIEVMLKVLDVSEISTVRVVSVVVKLCVFACRTTTPDCQLNGSKLEGTAHID
jgi:hypothetical protein